MKKKHKAYRHITAENISISILQNHTIPKHSFVDHPLQSISKQCLGTLGVGWVVLATRNSTSRFAMGGRTKTFRRGAMPAMTAAPFSSTIRATREKFWLASVMDTRLSVLITIIQRLL